MYREGCQRTETAPVKYSIITIQSIEQEGIYTKLKSDCLSSKADIYDHYEELETLSSSIFIMDSGTNTSQKYSR